MNTTDSMPDPYGGCRDLALAVLGTLLVLCLALFNLSIGAKQ